MSIRIDLVTRAWIEDLPGVPADPENGIFDVQLDGGFIRPGLDLDGSTTIETATQEQLDARAAFLAEQSLIDAAKQQLAALKAAHKQLNLDVAEIEVFLVQFGKANYQRAVAYRDAALAARQAYQAWVNNPPTSQQAVAALTTLFTAIGTEEENRRQADITYLSALQALKDAIDARDA